MDTKNHFNAQTKPGTRWYCLFFGYYSSVTDAEIASLVQSCSRMVRRSVVGDKRVFFEIDLSRSNINLGSLQFKIQSFGEAWELPSPLWSWGVGRTMAESWVQTRWKSLDAHSLPIEALDDFLYPLFSPLIASKQLGLGSSNFGVLRCLGYQSVADLGQLPMDLLLVRLASVLRDVGVQLHLATPDGSVEENWMSELTSQSLSCSTSDSLELESVLLSA